MSIIIDLPTVIASEAHALPAAPSLRALREANQKNHVTDCLKKSACAALLFKSWLRLVQEIDSK